MPDTVENQTHKVSATVTTDKYGDKFIVVGTKRAEPTHLTEIPSLQAAGSTSVKPRPHYTAEQIEELCQGVDALVAAFPTHTIFHASVVQIIRQLQKENAELSEIVTALQEEVKVLSSNTMTCNSSNFKVFE